MQEKGVQALSLSGFRRHRAGGFMKKALVFILVLFAAQAVHGRFILDLESGWIFPGYNNIRIPNKTGTLLSLSEELKTEQKLFWRIRAGLLLKERHLISLLAAPLTLNAKGKVNRDIFFFERNFIAGDEIKAKFRFDSYRLTYCYTLLKRRKIDLGLGFTAKIRDAEITLENSAGKSTKLNTGFVPIIHFNFQWSFTDRYALLINGDALASPGGQGRAEDIFAGLLFRARENVDIKMGYRILEGGADVDEVYNFTLVNYLSAGLIYRF